MMTPIKPFNNMWPFGHGVVMLAHSVEAGQAFLWVKACPDGFTASDGKGKQASWDEAIRLDAPTLILSFKDAAAIDNVVESLLELKGKLSDG